MGKRRISEISEATPLAATANNEAIMIQDRRTTSSTKSNYRNKIDIFKSWCLSNFPSAIHDGVILVPLPQNCIIAFLESLAEPAKRRMSLCGPSEIDARTAIMPYSAEYLSLFRCAIIDLYKQKNIKINDELSTEIKNTMKGYEKICNDLKKKNLMRRQKGKRELRLDGYTLIAKKLMILKQPHRGGQTYQSSTFAWSFYVLLWNLIGRPEILQDLTLERITWRQDCMTINDQV
jgi:hypothetical protein